MEIITLCHSSFAAAVSAATACLAAGGVIAAPTETVYGLLTCWNNQTGRQLIYRLKSRDERKPLQMLAAGFESVHTGAAIRPDDRLTRLAKAFWPGPLTVVVAGVDGSVGLRIPNDRFIQALLNKLQVPLAATSANLAGQPPATNGQAALCGLQGMPDMLIDGGEVEHGQASTVISLLGTQVKMLRPGPIEMAAIMTCLESG